MFLLGGIVIFLEKNANGFDGSKSFTTAKTETHRGFPFKTFLFKAVWAIACETRGSSVTG